MIFNETVARVVGLRCCTFRDCCKSLIKIIANEEISLPVREGEIDYEYMETLISAVQKLVIKEVVQYADREIAATRQVISQPL